jgi:excinuclease ABC subunit A
LRSLANHYGFDVDIPFNKLPKKIQKIVLYGSGNEDIEFHYKFGGAKRFSRVHAFEGVINNLERRYNDTDSEAVREELAKYLSTTPCDSCGGTRLRRSANNVFIADKNISDFPPLPRRCNCLSLK